MRELERGRQARIEPILMADELATIAYGAVDWVDVSLLGRAIVALAESLKDLAHQAVPTHAVGVSPERRRIVEPRRATPWPVEGKWTRVDPRHGLTRSFRPLVRSAGVGRRPMSGVAAVQRVTYNHEQSQQDRRRSWRPCPLRQNRPSTHRAAVRAEAAAHDGPAAHHRPRALRRRRPPRRRGGVPARQRASIRASRSRPSTARSSCSRPTASWSGTISAPAAAATRRRRAATTIT